MFNGISSNFHSFQNMPAATKKKYVVNEAFEKYILPDEKSYVVKIVAPRDNNLHEAITPDGTTFLISMPTKFRNTIYTKRGIHKFIHKNLKHHIFY
ncbi:unnamed protein product [Didymodactylos carnosus]|uniref:S1-like domain-containing protein n=1 Tax=Didymodactylos carnosus TaxID=1234261 RepID=A0A815ACL9_9BILA|nr:unnamed protein product [Didymodactylos carnosus]CAF4032009.1 unnamed protein product [Didymodactylos carnosus]